MGKEILKKGDRVQVERIYPNAEPHKGTFEEMDDNGDYLSVLRNLEMGQKHLVELLQKRDEEL